ncbi:MAG: zf-HC2 domain-containing protein [Oscillospiraceae bacterium]|nr:zf-HC2 domain-containing protein [Oscillospiraceae bacterium]MBR6609986.1 zf-HC2 domain-containing protein [Oscillospiraceae bacterium]
MNYPCEIIKDLMPMYIDDLCSEQSKAAVSQHIENCDDCRQYYNSMTAEGNYTVTNCENNEAFAQSLKKVKKQIRAKHIFGIVATATILLTFAVLSAVAAIGLQHIEYPILYENNITIDTRIPDGWEEWIADGNKYYVHCKGRRIEGVLCKEIKMENGEKYLFFQLTTNKWYDLITGKNHTSHQSFTNIEYYDRVYYYPGYIMEDLAAIADGEMEHIYNVSTLIADNTGKEK